MDIQMFLTRFAERALFMDAHYSEAIDDIVQGLRLYDMWGRIGYAEIKRRYRRTVIGPFWSSLSLAIFVVVLGITWSQLWKIDPKEYLPYLCAGMICWFLFSSFVTEGCQVFIASESLIKQLRISYMMLVYALVWRNLLVFAHNLLIYIPIAIYGRVPFNLYWFAAIPGIVFMGINGLWIALLLGILCARFRDVQQVTLSLLQIAIFVTPILWSPKLLAGRAMVLVDFNMLYHYIVIVRDPLMGLPPPLWSWVMVIVATIVGWAGTLYVYSRFRRRIPYWV